MRRPGLPMLCALLGILSAGLHHRGHAQEDIYFLVDSSRSIGKENFEHVRQFLYSTIKALHGGARDRFKFALVQYSGSPKTEFKLNTYPTTSGALAHIQTMTYIGGGPRTGLGLDFLIRTHLNLALGSRASDGVAQLFVVLTDGRFQDDVFQVLQLAGVDVFAVSVQDAADWELMEMASLLHATRVFNVQSFLALREIIQDLVVSLCGTVTRAGGAPVAIEARQGNKRQASCIQYVAMAGGRY